MNVWTSSRRSISLLTLTLKLGPNAAGAIPGDADADIVHASILGSGDSPVVPDGDHPATPMVPCDAVYSMIPAPVIPVSVIAADADR